MDQLKNVTLPADAPRLLCEECEDTDAVAWCDVDREVLCARCCELLFPRTSTGSQHPFFAGHKIRVLCRGDKSAALRAEETPDHFGHVITEDRWERLGRNLRNSSAVEAPKKNPINATSRSNRPNPKFGEGDIVVFDVEDQLPTEVQGRGRLPPWRNREIWGRVMGTAHPRMGQYGHAVRDGDEHEPWYRVQCMRWVKVESRPSARGSGMGHCNAYAVEIAAADLVFEERHIFDRKKDQIMLGIELPGFTAAPFARQRTLAWIRDRQIKNTISTRRFALGEVFNGEQSDASSFPTAILMQESALAAPAERRAAPIRRRAHQCAVVLRIVDGWLCERRLVNAFLMWVTRTFHCIEAERDKVSPWPIVHELSRGRPLTPPWHVCVPSAGCARTAAVDSWFSGSLHFHGAGEAS